MGAIKALYNAIKEGCGLDMESDIAWITEEVEVVGNIHETRSF
jgi:hypothetical protein